MALDMLSASGIYKLPLERLFATEGVYRILDCLLSNYELEQKFMDIVKFTKLEIPLVENGLLVLEKEKLVSKHDDIYQTKITSDRLSGLFSYYRATMSENLKRFEFRTVDLK